FAPRIHTRPYGTRPPKIFRPRTRGLEYSMVIVFPLANWHMAVAGGLSCARATTGVNSTTTPIANAVLFHSMRSLLACTLLLWSKYGPTLPYGAISMRCYTRTWRQATNWTPRRRADRGTMSEASRPFWLTPRA